MFNLRRLTFLALAFIAIAGTTYASGLPYAPQETDVIMSEQLLVTLEPGVSRSAITAILDANGGSIDKVLNKRVMRVTVAPEKLVTLTIELSADPRVARVEYYRTMDNSNLNEVSLLQPRDLRN